MTGVQTCALPIFPYLPSQVLDKKNMPSMSQDMMVEAITAALEAIADTKEDIKVTGGATH